MTRSSIVSDRYLFYMSCSFYYSQQYNQYTPFYSHQVIVVVRAIRYGLGTQMLCRTMVMLLMYSVVAWSTHNFA
jgi:hypothetical protein